MSRVAPEKPQWRHCLKHLHFCLVSIPAPEKRINQNVLSKTLMKYKDKEDKVLYIKMPIIQNRKYRNCVIDGSRHFSRTHCMQVLSAQRVSFPLINVIVLGGSYSITLLCR